MNTKDTESYFENEFRICLFEKFLYYEKKNPKFYEENFKQSSNSDRLLNGFLSFFLFFEIQADFSQENSWKIRHHALPSVQNRKNPKIGKETRENLFVFFLQILKMKN